MSRIFCIRQHNFGKDKLKWNESYCILENTNYRWSLIRGFLVVGYNVSFWHSFLGYSLLCTTLRNGILKQINHSFVAGSSQGSSGSIHIECEKGNMTSFGCFGPLSTVDGPPYDSINFKFSLSDKVATPSEIFFYSFTMNVTDGIDAYSLMYGPPAPPPSHTDCIQDFYRASKYVSGISPWMISLYLVMRTALERWWQYTSHHTYKCWQWLAGFFNLKQFPGLFEKRALQQYGINRALFQKWPRIIVYKETILDPPNSLKTVIWPPTHNPKTIGSK